eukprot:6900619-Pyramimonas_sp.AAC.2
MCNSATALQKARDGNSIPYTESTACRCCVSVRSNERPTCKGLKTSYTHKHSFIYSPTSLSISIRHGFHPQ